VERVLRVGIAALLLGAALLPDRRAHAAAPQPAAAQIQEYNAEQPKTVVELQQFRVTTSIPIADKSGRAGQATLINLNPDIADWFLLHLEWADGRNAGWYHLENVGATSQQMRLDAEFRYGVVIAAGEKKLRCDLWSGATSPNLNSARETGSPYASLCDGHVYLRNKTIGSKTAKEWVTDFLRDYVPAGEVITNFVKEKFFADALLEVGKVVHSGTQGHVVRKFAGAPARMLVDPRHEGSYLVASGLGIALQDDPGGRLLAGHWYAAKDMRGVFVSLIQPDLVSQEVVQRQAPLVPPLDEVESKALVYLVAFDLDEFEAGWAMGTDQPRVDWSDRPPENVRDNRLPGPDGIGTVAPLVDTGVLSPAHAQRVAATFAGGFRRYHGAFKWGDLAQKNHGSHYGFLESGVVMSKLQPGLATFLVLNDGTVDLRTWTERDNEDLARIRYARQNGVPIIDYDRATGTSRAGDRVKSWALGNWSGSQDKHFRTVRAGLCLEENAGDPFLVFGYFSSATSSPMARVFEAARCKYAMLLDMNALEHTYMAAYRVDSGGFKNQHLIQGMHAFDKSSDGVEIPRFVGYPDNRDFFYLLWKSNR
jgi:hypothetical protein